MLADQGPEQINVTSVPERASGLGCMGGSPWDGTDDDWVVVRGTMHFRQVDYMGQRGKERVVVQMCPIGTINVALCATESPHSCVGDALHLREQEVYQRFGLSFGYEPRPEVGAEGCGVGEMGGAIKVTYHEI